MRQRIFVHFTIAAFAFVGISTIAIQGCSKDDSNDRRLSQKGETCQTTNDCAGGLSCIPATTGPSGGVGVCVTGEFKIAQTTKECAVIQCAQPVDCCPTPPPSCQLLQAACADAGATSFACEEYDAECKCDASRYDCTDGQCKGRCQADTDCGAGKCSGGRCVQCVDDSTCTNGKTCVNGACQAPCTSDGDCPAFNRCNAGKCVDSGCKSDRECVAATRNVEATCGTDGKCIIPCQTDLECGSPKAYQFYSCINRQCVYVGCASDKDCELYLTGGSDAGIPSSGSVPTHIVCRDRATTNTH